MNREDIAYAYAKQYLKQEERPIPIGRGAYAKVFQTSGIALKITTDRDDAILMSRVRDGSFGKVVEVKSVQEFQNRFIIVTELLRTISRKEHENTNEDAILLDYIPEIRWVIQREYANTDRSEVEEQIEHIMEGFVIQYGVDGDEDNKLLNFLMKTNEQILDILDDIRPLQMENLDLHAYNIGWDSNGVMKILDLGCNSSDGVCTGIEEITLEEL